MKREELYDQLKKLADAAECGVWYQGLPEGKHTCVVWVCYVDENRKRN